MLQLVLLLVVGTRLLLLCTRYMIGDKGRLVTHILPQMEAAVERVVTVVTWRKYNDHNVFPNSTWTSM